MSRDHPFRGSALDRSREQATLPEGTAELPQSFELMQNYPNPFNPNTVIEFFNPGRRRTKVTLEVFNILGERVVNLYDDAADPGWNRVEWDGRNQAGETVASGIYFYRLKSGDFTTTRKMLLLR